MSEKTETKVEDKKEKTSPESKKPTEMTPEELEEQKNNLMQRMYPGYEFKEPDRKKAEVSESGIAKPEPVKPPEKTEEKTQEEKDKEALDAEAKKKADEEKAKKDKEATEEVIAPPLSEFKVPKTDTKDTSTTDTKLSKRDQRTVGILKKLEEMDPSYRGKSDEYVAYLSSAEAYISTWQKENPGKKFNAKDDDHQEFFTNNRPQVDDDDLEDARLEYIKDELRAENQSAIKKETDDIRKEQEVGRREPQIAKNAELSVLEFIKYTDESLAKHIKTDDDGNMYLDKEGSKAMAEEDEISANAINEGAEPLRIMITELEKASSNPDKFKFDASKRVFLKESGAAFYPHNELLDFMNDFEAAMLKVPASQTARQGRRLVSSADWHDMVGQIQKSNASKKEKEKSFSELESKYYAIGPTDIRLGLIAKMAGATKRTIEKLKRLAGHKKADGTENKDKPKEETSTNGLPNKKETKSPNLASNSDSIDTGKKSNAEGQLTTDKAVLSMWGR